MIENNKQLRVTKTALAKFYEAVEDLTPPPEDAAVNDKLRYELYRSSFKMTIEELETEIQEYEQKTEIVHTEAG